MKLLGHLNETIEYTTEEIGKILLKDCQPFIQEMKQERQMLWRGTEMDIDGIKKYTAKRTERSPKDMPIWVHNYLNDLYVKRIGWPVRSGVFCYNENITDTYGKPKWLFPIGNYRYIWSREIDDLFHIFVDWKMEYIKDQRRAGVDPNKISIKNNDIREWATAVVEMIPYHNSHYGRAGARNEISVWCDEYYLVDAMDRSDFQILMKMLF